MSYAGAKTKSRKKTADETQIMIENALYSVGPLNRVDWDPNCLTVDEVVHVLNTHLFYCSLLNERLIFYKFLFEVVSQHLNIIRDYITCQSRTFQMPQ